MIKVYFEGTTLKQITDEMKTFINIHEPVRQPAVVTTLPVAETKKPTRKVAKKTKQKTAPKAEAKVADENEVDLKTLCKDKCREVATQIPDGLKIVHQLFLRHKATNWAEVNECDYFSIIRECEELLS